MNNSYRTNNPQVWDKTSNAAANFIALQAYMCKPESQVDSLQLLNLIDGIRLALLDAKYLIDPLPPVPSNIEAEFAPINHSEIQKSFL